MSKVDLDALEKLEAGATLFVAFLVNFAALSIIVMGMELCPISFKARKFAYYLIAFNIVLVIINFMVMRR